MLKYMDYALAVYEEKSFTKAAEKLFISQPSLSLTIKKLEDELGFSIFLRRGKEVTLTPLGEKYINAVREIRKVEDDFKTELEDTINLKKGRLNIGSTTFIASYILPDIIKKFTEIYPGITIHIGVVQSTSLYDKLEKGFYDLIIDNSIYKDDRFNCTPLFKEKILLGIPSSFSVNEKLSSFSVKDDILISSKDYKSLPRLNVKELEGEKFILLKHGNKMREISDGIFQDNGITPFIAQEFDLLMTSANYAEHDFGICFLTDTVLRYSKKTDNLKYYIPDTDKDIRTVYIIEKNNYYQSISGKTFISHLKNHFK